MGPIASSLNLKPDHGGSGELSEHLIEGVTIGHSKSLFTRKFKDFDKKYMFPLFRVDEGRDSHYFRLHDR